MVTKISYFEILMLSNLYYSSAVTSQMNIGNIAFSQKRHIKSSENKVYVQLYDVFSLL